MKALIVTFFLLGSMASCTPQISSTVLGDAGSDQTESNTTSTTSTDASDSTDVNSESEAAPESDPESEIPTPTTDDITVLPEAEDSGEEESTEDPEPEEEPAEDPEPEEEPEEDPAPEEEAGEGLPFGFWGLNGYTDEVEDLEDVKERFGITLYQTTAIGTGYVPNTLLPRAQEAGMKVGLNMTGWHGNYTDGDGNFDVDMWIDQMSNWEGVDLSEYIADGTLFAHMLLDDIDTFPGEGPSAQDLDDMAEYSKSIFPNLLVYVRHTVTKADVPDGGQYKHVDAFLNQYKAYEGNTPVDVEDFAEDTYETAQDLGVGIINGLNICDGGDGSSGVVGWRSDKYAMSATEISEYGKVLMEVDGLIAFLMWEYDKYDPWHDDIFTTGAPYFDQDELTDAIFGLSEFAADY